MTLNEQKFYIPKKKITKKWLEQNHFYYSRILSDSDCDIYTNRFTVWRYGTAGIIECELTLDTKTGKIYAGCYDYGTRHVYAGWYIRDFGQNKMVEDIDEKIMSELKRLEAKEVEEKDIRPKCQYCTLPRGKRCNECRT